MLSPRSGEPGYSRRNLKGVVTSPHWEPLCNCRSAPASSAGKDVLLTTEKISAQENHLVPVPALAEETTIQELPCCDGLKGARPSNRAQMHPGPPGGISPVSGSHNRLSWQRRISVWFGRAESWALSTQANGTVSEPKCVFGVHSDNLHSYSWCPFQNSKIMCMVVLGWGLSGSSLLWVLSLTFTSKVHNVILFNFMDPLSSIA